MQEVWTESFVASVTESDFAGRVRLSALLGAMQNAADRHLENAGVSVGRMLEEGMAWVLMTTRLELSSTPRLNQSLSLETWNCGATGVQWMRDYRFLDAEGEEVARASTAWTLVDIAKRRILRPSAFPFPLPVSGRPSLEGPPEKVSLAAGGSVWSDGGIYTVPYSAVDCYGHMNNARYADLCTDMLTPEELREYDIRSICMTYSREAAMGDRITLRRGADGEGRILVSGESDAGRKTFEAVLELGPNPGDSR